MQEDLLVGYGVLGYFVCSRWCGVEVQINGFGSKVGVLGVPPPGLWFGNWGRGSNFLAGWRLIGMVDVYSCFAIGSDEYLCFIHPCRFPVDIEPCGEDWCIFVFKVCSIECVGCQPAVYILAGLFVGEGFRFPIVNVVDGVMREVYVVVNCCDVEWCICGMLW